MARIDLELGPGEAFRVYGPARISVIEGSLSILGADLRPGDSVEIASLRSYAVFSENGAKVSIELGDEGRIEAPAKGEDHYIEWLRIADEILDGLEGPGVVAVMGPVEAGKTSYAALLANRALSRGIAPAIVDADIGQADIGPPGFIALGMPGSWVSWLRALEPEALKFIGSIEPGPVAGKLIVAVSELVRLALDSGAGLVVIDTDGWTQGLQAAEVKADLASTAGADAVVVLGDSTLAGYLRRSLRTRVYEAPTPVVKAVRNRGDRRRLRSENYRRFLEGIVREINLYEVSVRGSCLFAGEPIKDPAVLSEATRVLGAEAVMAARIPGGLCIALDSEDPPEPQAVRSLQKRLDMSEILVVYRGGFQGVLSALTGPDGSDYPALLVDIDLKSGLAKFKTRYQGEVIAVSFSRIRLSEDYTEEARGRIWL